MDVPLPSTRTDIKPRREFPIVSDSTDGVMKKRLQNFDVFTRYSIVAERFPDEIAINRVKSNLEIY